MLMSDGPVVSFDWFSLLSQYGVLGLVCAALFIFARSQIRREQERADRLEAQLTQLNNATAEKVIPALVSATQLLQETQQLLRDMSRDRGNP